MQHRSRVLGPGCSWLTLPELDTAVPALRAKDSFALAALLGMQKDASDIGLKAAFWKESLDYRAPIDRAPERVNDPPWLGEFKAQGKPRKGKAGLDWRMYFSEPIERVGLVVVCGLGWKDPVETKAQGERRQDDAIRSAMKLFQRFCKECGLTYPRFEPR